ncbi:MAG: hypothetical protein K2X87_11050 [Gemmataceae bacterium]|nr:hypothetical protein [Gemmataceae bacterium]
MKTATGKRTVLQTLRFTVAEWAAVEPALPAGVETAVALRELVLRAAGPAARAAPDPVRLAAVVIAALSPDLGLAEAEAEVRDALAGEGSG